VRVDSEVLERSRSLKGWVVGKFEVLPTNVDDNAARLAKVLDDGDLVVSAGGDGTATITLNGVMLSKAKDLKLGVLGYGNFNDMSRALGMRDLLEIVKVAEGGGEGRLADAWGMECLVNGEHWRWALCYFTVGLFAESCAVFEKKDNRRELRTGKRGLVYSVWLLKKWYFKNRKRKFLENFVLTRAGQEKRFEGMTDYMAVNGKSMARVMRGGKWFLDEESFLGETRNLRGLGGLLRLMIGSILRRIPGAETCGDKLTFDKPTGVMIQAEGEYKRLEGVETIEIRKAERPAKVVLGRGI